MNFNISTIKSNFISTVGFSETVNIPLSSVLKTSNSGVIVNDNSISYLNIDFLKDLLENTTDLSYIEWSSSVTYPTNYKVRYTFPTYSALATYANGQYVNYNGNGYKSLSGSNIGNDPETNFAKWQIMPDNFTFYISILGTSNTNKQPDLQPTFWLEKDLFSELLESRLSNATINVIESCTKTDNTIFEQNQLFYGIPAKNTLIQNVAGQTVGMKIRFNKKKNVKAKINKIGIFFTDVVTDLEFTLWCQNTKITSQKLTSTSNDFAWFDLTGFDLSIDNGGDYYLTYESDDLISLSVQAIDNEWKNSLTVSNFLDFNYFTVATGSDLKTVSTANYKQDCFISNIDYSIFPDITNFLVNNKNIFAQAIKLQFAIDIYKLLQTNENKRTNNAQRTIDKDFLLLQTTDKRAESDSLINKFMFEIDNIKKSIANAKVDCLSFPKTTKTIQSFSIL
jgi:hypothetical protein